MKKTVTTTTAECDNDKGVFVLVAVDDGGGGGVGGVQGDDDVGNYGRQSTVMALTLFTKYGVDYK